MLLSELIDGLNLRVARGDAALSIPDLTDDSRAVAAGWLFVARSGSRADGRSFIADAIQRGAAAVVTSQEPPDDLPAHVAWVQGPAVDNPLVGELAERFFGYPGRKLVLIGVTGTNGKTTITFVIRHLLACAAVRCGVIGTVVIDDGATSRPAELTTPGAIDFSRYLAAMVHNGCTAAVAEVSSHALHQGRAAALPFRVGIFTNLTGDHLDYHRTMEAYAAAKAILFERLPADGWAVVNGADPWTPRMLRDCKARPFHCYVDNPAPAGDENTCHAAILEMSAGQTRIRFAGPWGAFEVNLPLVGRHNAMNVLQAVTAANCVTSLARTLRKSLETCPAPPGRLEPVRISDLGFGISDLKTKSPLPSVFVDYAHTHDALENVLATLRPLTRGRLLVVFGCGGDRDRTKRPRMAAVVCRLCDLVVITSDNPRTEDPMFIIGQILEGVPHGIEIADCSAAANRGAADLQKRMVVGIAGRAAAAAELQSELKTQKPEVQIFVEPDRAKAIAMAVEMAGPDDVVLLAGKGHEDYQIIGTTKRHFDDREEAAKALEAKRK